MHSQLVMQVVKLVFRTILMLRRSDYFNLDIGKELTKEGFNFLAMPRRLPLRAATHMNATLHRQCAYHRTTGRTSNSESWRDEGMARRYAIRPDRNASSFSMPLTETRLAGYQPRSLGIELFLFRR
jgi:hypothetical protein